MKSLLLSFSLFLSVQLSAQTLPYQPFAKDDRHWAYVLVGPNTTYIFDAFLLSIQGDTLYQGAQYKKLYKRGLRVGGGELYTPQEIITPPSLYGLIQEDTMARKVYYQPIADVTLSCQADEYLLYDFSLQVGDTMNSCYLTTFHSSLSLPTPIIDSIKQVDYYGMRRGFYSTYTNESVTGPLSDVILYLEGYGVYLGGILYDMPGRSLYPIILRSFCEGSFAQCNITSGNEEPTSPLRTLRLSPNPAHDRLILQPDQPFQTATVTLFNSLGALVKTYTLAAGETELSVADLPPGSYALQVRLDGGKVWNGVFVKM